jgi:hypothetical protein
VSAVDVLRTDQDPRRLVHAAQELAVSTQPQDQAALLQFLTASDLLGRLDDDARYLADRRTLRVRRVLDRLRRNPAGHGTLAALCADRTFLSHPSRIDLLIVACADVRPPPDTVLRLWNHFSQPDDGFGFLTIQALADNGTQPAILILRAKLLDPVHPDEDKIVWMRTSILAHRTDAPLLRGLQPFVQGGLPEGLRLALIEALVDWRPEQWYSIHGYIRPPAWARASPDAAATLRAIAAHARTEPGVTERIRQRIDAMLQELPAS